MMALEKFVTGKNGFSDDEKSSFKWWFSHWCAVNMIALDLHIWHPRYLLHDVEKPWLKLFFGYKFASKWHKTHRRHHVAWAEKHGWDNFDFEQMAVDNEACRFTKQMCPLNAREFAQYIINDKTGKYSDTCKEKIKNVMLPLLDKLAI